jgi:signal transduction histidine kinase
LLQLDPARLRLLLRNLLDNALRHSVEASQAPLLRIRASAQGGVELSVRDYGAGVPPEQLPQLAQAFYRPDAARTRDDGGVGLGLYLCKLVAQAHGGTFGIANASPGLVITVTLPP